MRSTQSLPHACAIALVLACNVHDLGGFGGPLYLSPPLVATSAVIPDLARHRSRVIEQTDDMLRVLAGSLRVELTAREVALAEDRFALQILGAARATDGWLFLAEDGSVARADSFLGPLQPLGHVPRPEARKLPAPLTATCGRLAYGTPDPRASLWTTDGTAPIAPAPGTPPGIVMSAAFADADHGMVVLDGGELFVTRDGAGTFERVPLGRAAAKDVACLAGELYVTTSTGIAIFDRGGTRVGSARPAPPPALEPGAYARIAAAALRRYGDVVAESFGGVVAADGRVLVPIEHALQPIAGTPSNAGLRALGSARDCTAVRWGRDVAMTCSDGLFRVDARTLHSERLAGRRDGERACATLSGDGDRAVWSFDPWVWAGAQSQCTLVGGRVTQRPLGGNELVGIRDGQPVVVLTALDKNQIGVRDAAHETDLQRFDLRGAALQIGHQIPYDAWQLSADGTTAINTAAGWLVHVALSDGAVTTRRLPDGAYRTGFVTGEQGVAAGEDLATLWLTDDGGAHWHPHSVPVEGALFVPHAELREEGGYWHPDRPVACSGSRCVIDKHVVVSFDTTPLSSTGRVLASSADPDVFTMPPPERALGCAYRGAARPAPRTEDRDDRSLDENGRTRFQRPGVDVTLRRAPDDSWHASWHGRDWRGPYTARYASGPLEQDAWNTSRVELLYATRDGIVISPRDASAVAVWMPAGGQPRAILDDASALSPGSRVVGPEIEDVLTLPDGALAVLFAHRRDGPPTGFHELMVVDRSGKVTARRTFFWDGWPRDITFRSGIAVLDGTVGIETSGDQTRPGWFFSIEADAARREIARLDPATTPICPARKPGALSIRVANTAAEPSVHETSGWIRHVYLHGSAPACMQAIELGAVVYFEGREVFAIASPARDLRTEVYQGDIYRATRQEVRCAAP